MKFFDLEMNGCIAAATRSRKGGRTLSFSNPLPGANICQDAVYHGGTTFLTCGISPYSSTKECDKNGVETYPYDTTK
jgi:hypothetical protein